MQLSGPPARPHLPPTKTIGKRNMLVQVLAPAPEKSSRQPVP
jgi:hypothetical protein